MLQTNKPARVAHMHSMSTGTARKHLEDGATIGPRLWGHHNIWMGRRCVGRITDHIFQELLPALTRVMGEYEVRWRIADDHISD